MASCATVVTLNYAHLKDPTADLSAHIEQAYGPNGLGILTVGGVPDFPELRQQLLPLAARLAMLPNPALASLEDPASRYSFGWSCGKEVLEGGQPDEMKGSFYANPLLDDPAAGDEGLRRRYPGYCSSNVWPCSHLPQLEPALKALGRLIVKVGLLLARHCDAYCAAKAGHPRRLHDIVRQSPCPKARLLHYFAPAATSQGQPAGEISGDWCGWHYDHGSLTGLCSAMYLDGEGAQGACPDRRAGLYVRDRAGHTVQVAIPPDHLAFQVGEAMQVHSGGLLRATPHCVVAPAAELSAGISRNTFAVFMQPRWDCPMDPPAGASPEEVGIGCWRPGLDFGAFSELTLDAYYR